MVGQGVVHLGYSRVVNNEEVLCKLCTNRVTANDFKEKGQVLLHTRTVYVLFFFFKKKQCVWVFV